MKLFQRFLCDSLCITKILHDSFNDPVSTPIYNIDEAKGSVQKASKRCESEAESNIPAKKSTLERNKDAKTALACTTKETVSSPRKGLLAPPAQSPAQQQCNNGVTTVNESTPTHDGPKEDFKRSLKAQKISAISLNDMDASLNSHEITFNISMTEFDDALEEEKKAMFQMTYDESIRKAEKVQVWEPVCLVAISRKFLS
jgi:hypothetical protein